jgi:hypothetical protein
MRLWLRVLASACLTMLPGCGSAMSEEIEIVQADREQADRIAERSGVTLPPEAQVIHASSEAGQDDASWLVFDLTQQELDRFMEQPALSGMRARLSPLQNAHLGPDRGKWAPSAADGLASAQQLTKNGREALNLGVGQAGGKVRVFLFWHQL